MARTMSVPCRRDLACYRNDGHAGDHAYATPDTVPTPAPNWQAGYDAGYREAQEDIAAAGVRVTGDAGPTNRPEPLTIRRLPGEPPYPFPEGHVECGFCQDYGYMDGFRAGRSIAGVRVTGDAGLDVERLARVLPKVLGEPGDGYYLEAARVDADAIAREYAALATGDVNSQADWITPSGPIDKDPLP